MSLGHHLCLRLADDRVLAPAPLQRRVVARVVLAQAKVEGLLAFGLADTHLHILVTCSRGAAGQLARRVELALGRRLNLDVGFARPHIKPVENGFHLRRAFTYVLEQAPHHGLAWDPLHEACCLPDLLGLRPLGAFLAADVRRALPRVTRADLLACLQLAELQPADGPLDQLVVAAVAAAALPNLEGRCRESFAVRGAAVQLVARRWPAVRLASLLQVSPRTVHQLRGRPGDPRLVDAVRLQLGLLRHRTVALLDRERPFLAS